MFSRFFITPSKVNSDTLPETTFSPKNYEHLNLIQKRIDAFKSALADLEKMDYYLIILFGGGYVTATFISTLLGLSAWCLAGNFIACRTEYTQKYQKALGELIEVYQWAMKKDATPNLRVSTIQDLISTLGPWASKNTLQIWDSEYIPTELPSHFKESLRSYMTGKQELTPKFVLYGENGFNRLFESIKDRILTNAKEQVATPNGS